MFIEKKVTVTNIEKIEIELPYFTKKGNRYHCIKHEDKTITVADVEGFSYISIGNTINEAIEGMPCDSSEFYNVLDKVNSLINTTCYQVVVSEVEKEINHSLDFNC